MKKITGHLPRCRRKQQGVYTVELTLSLLFFVVFVLIFWEYTAAFIAHQRVTYAAFMAERSRVVGGNPIKVAMDLKGGQVYVGDDRVLVRDELDLPLNIIKPWGGDAITYIVSREVSMPREPEDFGDNMWMPVEPMGGTIPDFGPDPIEQFAENFRPKEDPKPKTKTTPDPAKEKVPNPEIPEEDITGNCKECPVEEAAANSSGKTGQCASNPINFITGNKYQREVDLTYPGSIKLVWSRHYNSLLQQDSLIGHGWQHSFQAYLGIEQGIAPPEQAEELSLLQADGRVVRFRATDGGSGKKVYDGLLPSDGRLVAGRSNYRWHWRNGRTLQFDLEGKLRRISLTSGENIVLDYDARNRLVQVEDEKGRAFKLSYRDDRIDQVVGIEGMVVKYRYDDKGNLTHSEYSDGTTKQYHYENTNFPHHLTGITDQRGIRLSHYNYDGQGRGILSTHAGDVDKVKLTYKDGQTLVTNSLDQLTTFSYSNHGEYMLVDKVDGGRCSSCGENDVSYQYNDHAQIIKKISKETGISVYAYDEHQRLIRFNRAVDEESLVDETAVIYEYSEDRSKPYFDRPTSIIRASINPNGQHRTTMQYDQWGQLVEVIEQGYRPTFADTITDSIADQVPQVADYQPIVKRSRLHYDKQGRLTALDGPREDIQDIFQILYDDKGQVARLQPPGGAAFKFLSYDQAGRPTKVQLHESSPFTIRYTDSGKVREIEQMGQTLRYQYDQGGELLSLTGPDGQQLSIRYDQAHRGIEMTDDAGVIHKDVLDTENNLLSREIIGPNGELVEQLSYLYDANSRLTEIRDQANSQVIESYEYESDGLEAIHVDGNRISSFNTALGHVVSVENGDTEKRISYDSDKKLNEVMDANGELTRYIRDDFGQLVLLQSADMGIIRYRYDEAGNRVEKQDALGEVHRYGYDAMGRLIKKVNSDGTHRYQYDAVHGQLRTVQGDNEQSSFSYDIEGRLVEHTRKLESGTFSSGYRYDQDGRIWQKYLPNGQQIRYQYYTSGNKRGKLRAMILVDGGSERVIAGELDLDERDGTMQIDYGNGTRSNWDFQQGQLSGIDNGGLGLRYQYNERGEITQIDHAGMITQYEYDHVGQLTKIHSPQQTTSYSYDDGGNRMDEQSPDDDKRFKYGPGNRLQKAGEANYDYNAAGSPLLRGAYRYQYNAEQRPIRVYEGDALIAEYQYNSFGERIKKVKYTPGKSGKPGKVVYYLYDGNRITAEADADGNITKQYVYLADRIIAVLNNDQVYAVHGDHLGTPHMLTNQQGQVVWQAEYEAFGLAIIEKAQLEFNLRFQGQYYDDETKTHYNYFRDYDPLTGRYLTADPIGQEGGINVYAYVDNNPLSSIDPLGLAGQSSAAGGGLPDGTAGKPTASTNSQLSDKYDDIASSIEDESVRDFLWGIKDGVLTQIDDLMDILKHPGEFLEAILDLLIQIFKDPEAVLEVLLEELEDDLKRLIYCGAYERGKVIGENITPVVLFKVLKKLIKKKCSFRGDMLVLTSVGYIAISSIQAGIHEVFAKDEFTGEQGYREVLDQYSNPYEETVYVEIEDGQGNVQTIVSNRVHPFYVEGEWKRADALVAGDKLTGVDGAKLVVRGIRVEQEALQAYNLSVAGFHSYFVKGVEPEVEGVWVHNSKGCAEKIKNAKKTKDKIKDNAAKGKVRRKKDYHGRLDADLEQDILSDPDSVYLTDNNNLIFHKDGNVVIVDNNGSNKGQVITSYGKDGPRGESGASVFGGNPSDPGKPITESDIKNGNVSKPGGSKFPPATKIE